MKTRHSKIFLALKFALLMPAGLVLLASNSANAATAYTAAADDSWSTSTTWSPVGGPPTTADSATIGDGTLGNAHIVDAAGGDVAHTVLVTNNSVLTVSGGSAALGTLTISGSGSNGVTIAQGGELDISFAGTAGALQGTLSVANGTVSNSGYINMGNTGAGLAVYKPTLIADTLDNTATGTITLGGTTTTRQATINVNNFALENSSASAVYIKNATDNINVARDYKNVNFGSGNTFSTTAPTNVAGSGAVVFTKTGATQDQAITVTGSAQTKTDTTANLTGNIHTSTSFVANGVATDTSISKTVTYTIDNTSTTNQVIRGAVQTTGAGIGVADTHLSGSGVTPAGAGSAEAVTGYAQGGGIAQGASSAALSVKYTADGSTAAGAVSLTGTNAVNVVNNFTEQQKLTVGASGLNAYDLATPTSVSSPIVVAAQHVSGTNAADVSVTNNANGSFGEDLKATLGSSTSDAQIKANGVGGLGAIIHAGETSNTITAVPRTSLQVGVDTTLAGLRTGTVGLTQSSEGSTTGHVTSGLGTTALNPQNSIGVQGAVWAFADPSLKVGATSVTTINLGQFLVGYTPGTDTTFNVGNLGGTNNGGDTAYTDTLHGGATPFDSSALAGFFSFVGSAANFNLLDNQWTSNLQANILSGLALGHYDKILTLSWNDVNDALSFNDPRTYNIHFVADVVSGVDEPGVMWLFGSAGLAWFATNKKKAVKA